MMQYFIIFLFSTFVDNLTVNLAWYTYITKCLTLLMQKDIVTTRLSFFDVKSQLKKSTFTLDSLALEQLTCTVFL